MGLRLGKTVLIEIMAIVQRGILDGIDISQKLREIDVEVDPEENGSVCLTEGYVERRKNEQAWD